MKEAVSVGMFLAALSCSAQHQADKWYFGGIGSGLDFTGSCEPTVLSDGQIAGWEGCCTVSDETTGELLFYTNSEHIWNRDHVIMVGSDLQPPGTSVPQKTISQVLGLRVPGHDSLYYLITNHVQSDPAATGVHLACVDMTLNAGLGGVLFTDSVIYPDLVSEKITAIPHANGIDVWVIVHSFAGDGFLARLLTSQGFTGTWIESHIGKQYAPLSTDQVGEMKADPYGEKLAVTTYHKPHIELFDFDRGTGTVSNVITIPAQGGFDPGLSYSTSFWYGVSFSPDGSKLYAARQNSINPTDAIIQMDVTSGDSAVIAASTTPISTLNDCFSLQLAPNGKIYTRRSGNYLGVINHPNNSGTACGFDPQGVDLGNVEWSWGAWGFNNYMALAAFPCLDTSIGMEEPDQVVGVYTAPNPCGGRTTIHLPSTAKEVLIDVYDLRSATTIKSFRADHLPQYSMELGDVVPGIYLIRASEFGRTIGIAKLIVKPSN